MANFVGTAIAESFGGTAPVSDSVDYSGSTAAVSVDVLFGGFGGFAEFDMYTSIEEFILSGFDDLFVGDDDGNTVTGGAGQDVLFGGLGDDVFRIAAGDAVAGEAYIGEGFGDVGAAGYDTIQLVAGGSGSTFDLSGVGYSNIAEINFETAGTLVVATELDAAKTFGTAGAGEIVRVESWLGGNTDIAVIGATLLTYLNNGIDAVEWTEANDTVRAELDPDTGTRLFVTYTDTAAQSYTTRSVLFAPNFATERTIEAGDNGVTVISSYDATGGPGNEVLLTQTFEDLSAGSAAAPYDFAFYDYAAGGVVDGILDYSVEAGDNGVIVEQAFVGGVLQNQTSTDLSFDGLAQPYTLEQLTYYPSGALLSSLTVLDPGGPTQQIHVWYNEAGTVTETITTATVGPVTREYDGSAGDDEIIGDEDDEIFNIGVGEDTHEGNEGNDLFRLSDTLTDGNWAPGFFTYIQQGRLSDQNRVSVSIGNQTLVDDIFRGGEGSDTLLGTGLNDVVLLYRTFYTPTTSELDGSNARVVGIETFDMGDGNDILNLTSGEDHLGYLTDAEINGGAGDDYLLGGAGNDNIVGGTGLDRLVGWRGEDVLTGGTTPGIGDGTEDRFLFMPGFGGGTTWITDFEDNIDKIWVIGFGYSTAEFAAAVTNEAITISTAGPDTIVDLIGGGATTRVVLQNFSGTLDAGDFFLFDTATVAPPVAADNLVTIVGDAGNNVLTGTVDNDTFEIGAGADMLEGLDGNDTFELTGVQDSTWGAGFFTHINDVRLANGDRVSVSLSGREQINDGMLGGDGEDSLIGTSGDEAIVLYDPTLSAANPLIGDDEARLTSIEHIDMGDGNDIVNLTSTDSQLGYVTDVELLGAGGDDYLFGGAGNDDIIGGIGMDRIVGWRGDDVMTGGTAHGVGDGTEDRFLFGAESGGGRDRITDFEDGTDTIWVIGYGVGNFADAITNNVLDITVGVSDTSLTLTDGILTTEVLLEGVTTAIDMNDFVFFA